MADTYETLDKQIVAAIGARPRSDMWTVILCCRKEVDRLAEVNGRKHWRIAGDRLQALRKKGVIEYVPTDGDKRAGWVVKESSNG